LGDEGGVDHSHWRWSPIWVNRTNFAFSLHRLEGAAFVFSTLWGKVVLVKVENDPWQGFASFVIPAK